MSEIEWSKTEQKIARESFDKAYKREIDDLIKTVRQKTSAIAGIDDIWLLHDFLSAKRHEVDGKYDYRYSILVFVFAGLVKDGWLHLSELEGLDTEKLAKIAALAAM